MMTGTFSTDNGNCFQRDVASCNLPAAVNDFISFKCGLRECQVATE